MERSNAMGRWMAAVVLASVAVGVGSCGDANSDVATTGSTAPPAADPSEPTDGDTPVSSPPADPGDDTSVPADEPEPVDETDAQVLVGRALGEARSLAQDRAWSIRVARLDGQDQVLTDDYSPTRINVAVEDAVVVEVLFVG
jgi:hypothetical protein